MVFKPWYAFEAKVGLGSAVTTVNSTQTLKVQFEALSDEIYYTGRCKEISITGASRDVSKIDVLGANQHIQEERPDLVEIEVTLIYDESTSAKYIGGPASTSFTASEGTTRTYYRYQFGERTEATLDRGKLSVLFVLDDRYGTATTAQKVNIMLNNAYCTNRELNLSSDGHVEEKITLKGKMSDYYEEDNYDQTTWST
jgi:hypothetical protein